MFQKKKTKVIVKGVVLVEGFIYTEIWRERFQKQKVIFKDRWSLLRGSLTQKYEGKDFRKKKKSCWGVHLHRNLKGKIWEENVIFKDRWPLSRGSFTHKYEWKGFRKKMLKGWSLLRGSPTQKYEGKGFRKKTKRWVVSNQGFHCTRKIILKDHVYVKLLFSDLQTHCTLQHSPTFSTLKWEKYTSTNKSFRKKTKLKGGRGEEAIMELN